MCNSKQIFVILSTQDLGFANKCAWKYIKIMLFYFPDMIPFIKYLICKNVQMPMFFYSLAYLLVLQSVCVQFGLIRRFSLQINMNCTFVHFLCSIFRLRVFFHVIFQTVCNFVWYVYFKTNVPLDKQFNYV